MDESGLTDQFKIPRAGDGQLAGVTQERRIYKNGLQTVDMQTNTLPK
jgi:hypothetical protein